MVMMGSVNANWSTHGACFLFWVYLFCCYFSVRRCSIYRYLYCYFILQSVSYYLNFRSFALNYSIIFSISSILSLYFFSLLSNYFIFSSNIIFSALRVYRVLTKSPILAFSYGHKSVNIIRFPLFLVTVGCCRKLSSSFAFLSCFVFAYDATSLYIDLLKSRAPSLLILIYTKI